MRLHLDVHSMLMLEADAIQYDSTVGPLYIVKPARWVVLWAQLSEQNAEIRNELYTASNREPFGTSDARTPNVPYTPASWFLTARPWVGMTEALYLWNGALIVVTDAESKDADAVLTRLCKVAEET